MTIVFYFAVGKLLDKSNLSVSRTLSWLLITLKKREVLILFLLVLALKVFTIYGNSIWLISDESFYIHRGQAFLLYYGEKTGIITNSMGVETYQLENSFNRFPPLSMIIQGSIFALWGGIKYLPYFISNGLNGLQNHFVLDEMAARMQTLIFTLITVIMIFKLVNTNYDRKTSILASSMVLLMPAYFMYSSSAQLASGVMFFSITSVYFLMRFLKTEESSYMILCALVVSMGALYKRPLIFFALLMPFYILFFTKVKNRIGTVLRYSIIVTIITLPYYLMLQTLAYYRPFGSANLSASKTIAYLTMLPLQMTIPLAIISIISIYFVWNKNHLSRFSLIWFISWYVFFTFDWFVGDRITLPLMVPLSIFSADFIMSSINKLKTHINKEYLKYGIIIIITTFLVTESLIVFYGTDDIRAQYEVQFYDTSMFLSGGYNIKNNFFPYHETTDFLKSQLGESNLATVHLEGYAFFDLVPILEFYIRNLDGNQERNVFEINLSNKLDIDEIYNDLNNLDVRYVIIPIIDQSRFSNLLHETYSEKDISSLNEITELLTISKYFVLENTFLSENNGFYIFEIKSIK